MRIFLALLVAAATLTLSACSSGLDASITFESITTTDQAQFLIDNATRESVSVSESGLQYEVLRAGNDIRPESTDTVSFHFDTLRTDGTLLFSSIASNTPITAPLTEVIVGLQEGLQLMTVGSRYRLVIPPEIGSGAQTSINGFVIEADDVQVLEVELLEINSR